MVNELATALKANGTRAVGLLSQLIQTPSFSKDEAAVAQLILDFLFENNVVAARVQNNIWAKNAYFSNEKPTILLFSHFDTVKPNAGYTRDPFVPTIETGKLYGLGSNDAGASLVALLECFLHYYAQPNLPWNIVFAAVAEEEISGQNGIEYLLPHLGNIECAIVGEPTQLQMAIAERGLLVVDGVASGRAGHAAREEGENALYKALEDITWIKNHQFPQKSTLLGPVKMSVTMIQSGTQHNVVPDTCTFTVDIRVNECYSLEEVFQVLQDNTQSDLRYRSLRLRSTMIPLEHPLVRAGAALGSQPYGSPTLSDKALMHCPTLKIGPGDSARSHTADEFIYLHEIQAGIDFYIALLAAFFKATPPL